MLNKSALVHELQGLLEGELTRARLEGAGPDTVKDLERKAIIFRVFPVYDYSRQSLVEPGALVTIETSIAAKAAVKSHVLIVPQAGGLVHRFENEPVQVVSHESPMGEALLGKSVGDAIELGPRRVRIIGLC